MACLRIVAAIAMIVVDLTVSTPASSRDEIYRFFEEFEPDLGQQPRSATPRVRRHAESNCSWRSRSGRWFLVRSRNSLAYPHPNRKQQDRGRSSSCVHRRPIEKAFDPIACLHQAGGGMNSALVGTKSFV